MEGDPTDGGSVPWENGCPPGEGVAADECGDDRPVIVIDLDECPFPVDDGGAPLLDGDETDDFCIEN